MHAMVAIASMDATPFRLVFAGGTSLARAHRLIKRMSEDVDFRVVRTGSETISQNKLRQQLGGLRDQVSTALLGAGFVFDPADPAQLHSRDANQFTIYQLPHETAEQAGEGLRPTIQIELSYAQLRMPPLDLPVSSFVSEAFGRPPDIPGIACVNVTETAAEKLVSLTRRTAMELAGLSRNPDPTLVRHIYDLHMLRNHVDHPTLIALARDIALQDAHAFRNQHPAYMADVAGEARKALEFLQRPPMQIGGVGSAPIGVTPISGTVSVPTPASALYQSFTANMIYGEQVDFYTAMTTVSDLVNAAWP